MIEQFFRSYLIAYLFWLGVALGCLPVLMLHHLVGGTWGFVIRRILEAGTRTLPLMVVLFVPLLFAFLPESKAFSRAAGRAAKPAPVIDVLFGEQLPRIC